ncbi:glycosyltransferase [Virgibacillus sp. C22-A2]|uniref:Glycosyltransferase n=1 Tax=Virgibacillus tibetensis TaxID=3042313 RepID=A0ABU6KHV3_9BACI|nr:glycosyltransferase [Virgibacillus sp. C22-A2]
MEVKISIIVPIYNLHHLLQKCVDSILAQTFTEFELILVNDGSTDRSGNICDEYANLDKRVKVIHKENGGVASSRNAGLEVAIGKYIGFVDNDDYINEFMFETLYDNAIIHSSDIVVCDFQNVDEDQHCNTMKFDSEYRVQNFNNKEALNQIYTKKDATFVYSWNKLYRKHLFEDISYEFGNLYDDESVAHKLLYHSEKVTYIQTVLYYYVKRIGSIVNTPFHIKKFDRVYALKHREVFFRNKKEFDLHQKALKHYMEVFFWYYYMAKSNIGNVDKELKQLKSTFDKSLFFLLKHREIGWKQKLMCVLFSANPPLFELIKNGREKSKRTTRI